MPLTDELGDLILAELQYDGLILNELVPKQLPDRPPGWAITRVENGQFETWPLVWPRTSPT